MTSYVLTDNDHDQIRRLLNLTLASDAAVPAMYLLCREDDNAIRMRELDIDHVVTVALNTGESPNQNLRRLANETLEVSQRAPEARMVHRGFLGVALHVMAEITGLDELPDPGPEGLAPFNIAPAIEAITAAHEPKLGRLLWAITADEYLHHAQWLGDADQPRHHRYRMHGANATSAGNAALELRRIVRILRRHEQRRNGQ
jgi:hypothetical protein